MSTVARQRPISWREAWRLAHLGGAEERLRRGLILLCASVATIPVYFAAAVPRASWAPIDEYALDFLQDQGTRGGVAFALTLMMLPALYLAVVAVRVGSGSRDRRLAAMRAAGSTGIDVRRVMVAEALTWVVPGVLVGLGLGAMLWWVCASALTVTTTYWDPLSNALFEVPVLPDVRPNPRLLAAGAVGIVLLAAALAPLATRRVTVGMSGQEPALRPVSARLPAVMVGCAVAAAVAGRVVYSVERISPSAFAVLVLTVPFLLLVALTASAPLLTRALGSAIRGRGSAATMLAGAGMSARPRAASRASGAFVLVGLAGGFFAGLAGVLESQVRQDRPGGTRVDGVITTDLLYYLAPIWVVQAVVIGAVVLGAAGMVVATTEHAVTRRQSIQALVVSGAVRRVVVRATTLETGLTAAVLGPAALVVGLAIPAVFAVAAGAPALVDASWTYALTLFVLLAVAPFAAAWLGARVALRPGGQERG